MWRSILCQSAYQIFVMIILMYFGSFIFFDEPYHLIFTPLRDENGSPTDKLVNNTICFHAFIMMNLFNQINCRVIDNTETNVFKTLFNNLAFWIVFLVEVAIQHLMINAGGSVIGSALLGTTPLSFYQMLTCWLLGVFSLVVNIISKSIPLSNFAFSDQIDLEAQNEKELVNKIYKRASNVSMSIKHQVT